MKFDIDPRNLEFEFGKRWEVFKDSTISKFLLGWLDKRVEESRLRMETCEPKDLGKLQGQILELNKVAALLKANTSEVVDAVKQTISHLEKNYGR